MGQGLQFTKRGSYAIDPEMDQWVNGILQNNRHLNFVDRIVRPDLYPVLPIPGGIATHKMMWSEDNKSPFVYPKVIFDPESMKLKELEEDEAADHAMKTGEYIRFNSPEEAELFSQNYKRALETGKGPMGY